MNRTGCFWIAVGLSALWLAAAGCAPGPSEERPGEEAGAPDPEAPSASAGSAGAGETTMTTASGPRTSPASGAPGGSAPVCVGGAIADPAFDVSDERLLVGFADNVFVGRVVEEVGSEVRASGVNSPFMPRTRFSVKVVENVKGNLGGTVTVVQDGAYLPERGCVVLVNYDPLLGPGRTYMFLTGGDGGRDGSQQIVAPGYGDVPVDDRTDRRALVRLYEKAVEEQRDPFSKPRSQAGSEIRRR